MGKSLRVRRPWFGFSSENSCGQMDISLGKTSSGLKIEFVLGEFCTVRYNKTLPNTTKNSFKVISS